VGEEGLISLGEMNKFRLNSASLRATQAVLSNTNPLTSSVQTSTPILNRPNILAPMPYFAVTTILTNVEIAQHRRTRDDDHISRRTFTYNKHDEGEMARRGRRISTKRRN
jgi:hypothetical protein